MNAYEQLQEIREELEEREVGPETIRMLDRAINLAEGERDNPLSISQSMALQGDIDDRRAGRREEDALDATVDTERKPQHLSSYYKKQRQRGT